MCGSHGHGLLYRFKKEEERVAYITAMATFLPLLYSRMTQIIADHSLLSVTLQHQILKIFHATMQEAMEGEEEDRANLEWWKCKKWALHILCRFFDRYSNPSSIEEEYNLFSKYYLQTFN
ncbi:Importin-7, partial [Geodia barretti]